jgi:hypothetical protein
MKADCNLRGAEDSSQLRDESAPCRDLLLVDENFDPAIYTPTARRAVVGNRLARAVGNHTNLRRVEAFLADQISGDARSAPLSELVVLVLMAVAVGIPGDHENALRRRRPRVG